MTTKTSLSYWFPRLEAADIPVPKTIILEMPKEAQADVFNAFGVQVPTQRLRDGAYFPHSADCKEAKASYTDCRTEEGITVGLIDTVINSARLLAARKLEGRAISEALLDLRADPDVAKLFNAIAGSHHAE